MGLGGCYAFIKYLVVLVNFIFVLVALGVVSLAVWMIVDPSFYLSMTQDEMNYYIALYIFLGVGLLMLIVALLGGCGALKESRCMLIFFFSFLLIIVVAEVAAAAWAYFNADHLETIVRSSVKTTVQQEYGVVDTRTITFDAIQKGLHCCGSDGPGDWAGSAYNKVGKTNIELGISSYMQVYNIPESCCQQNISQILCKQATKIGVGAKITNIIYGKGCIDKLVETVQSQTPYVLAIGLGLAIFQFLGLVFSCVLCYAIRNADRYKA